METIKATGHNVTDLKMEKVSELQADKAIGIQGRKQQGDMYNEEGF